MPPDIHILLANTQMCDLLLPHNYSVKHAEQGSSSSFLRCAPPAKAQRALSGNTHFDVQVFPLHLTIHLFNIFFLFFPSDSKAVLSVSSGPREGSTSHSFLLVTIGSFAKPEWLIRPSGHYAHHPQNEGEGDRGTNGGDSPVTTAPCSRGVSPPEKLSWWVGGVAGACPLNAYFVTHWVGVIGLIIADGFQIYFSD